jgi:mannitol-1-/sugar-/sorbitol-6-phosphatase
MAFANHVTCKAILFDLDGVLVDSRRCVELVWRTWASGHGLDPDPIIRAAHGRRTSETLREAAPGLDIAAETALLDRLEEAETGGIFPVPGAKDLLQRLPPGLWAIVTSGSPNVATLRMLIGGIPRPSVFVTAHDVLKGKPSPEGYLIAARRLGVKPAECVVVEDTPAGILAGKEAGMSVIAIEGTYGPESLSGADSIAGAFSALRADQMPSGALNVAVAPL